MKKVKTSKKKVSKKVGIKPSANYAPLFRFKISDRDVIMDFGQPIEDKKILLISRIAMPLKSAKEFAELLKKVISNQKK